MVPTLEEGAPLLTSVLEVKTTMETLQQPQSHSSVSLGDLPSQIDLSSIQICIPNSEDNYDTISMTILSQQLQF